MATKLMAFVLLCAPGVLGACILGGDDDGDGKTTCYADCDDDLDACEVDCDDDDNACSVSCDDDLDECMAGCD
jgi:hypothetical protein